TGALHRDLTSANVLVDAAGHLHLADFGIARHAVGNRPVSADVFNPWFVTKGFFNNEHRYWLAVDDVFQMGQILCVLLSGDASSTIGIRGLRQLNCSDNLRSILRKAIGPRRLRYGDAFEMLQALT